MDNDTTKNSPPEYGGAIGWAPVCRESQRRADLVYGMPLLAFLRRLAASLGGIYAQALRSAQRLK